MTHEEAVDIILETGQGPPVNSPEHQKLIAVSGDLFGDAGAL